MPVVHSFSIQLLINIFKPYIQSNNIFFSSSLGRVILDIAKQKHCCITGISYNGVLLFSRVKNFFSFSVDILM